MINCSFNYASDTLKLINYSCARTCQPSGIDRFIYGCSPCGDCGITIRGFIILVAIFVVCLAVGVIIGDFGRRKNKKCQK